MVGYCGKGDGNVPERGGGKEGRVCRVGMEVEVVRGTVGDVVLIRCLSRAFQTTTPFRFRLFLSTLRIYTQHHPIKKETNSVQREKQKKREERRGSL